MSTKIVQDRFEGYGCASRQEAENAMAEISQEIALAGLSRSDFFKQAAFQGGTALRILYGVQRFSEDLDFALKQPNPNFKLTPYLEGLKIEFEAYGVDVDVVDRSKTGESLRKAFVKSDSMGKILSLSNIDLEGRLKTIKIKFEVDSNPPTGGNCETKYLDFPFPFPITTHDAPSLFAGKSHALLCREYVKGRDWFDFAWYVGRKTPLNYRLLSGAMGQTGPWKGQGIMVTKEWYLLEMEKKISNINWDEARRDVIRFLKPADLPAVRVWGCEYFCDRLQKLGEYL